MRVKITLSYKGSTFLGSQIQKSSPNTVNGTLELLLQKLHIHSKVIASGRTDKGVHATGQVVHIDIPKFWHNLVKLKRVLNEMITPNIKILQIKKVDDDFHARYDAKKRVYRYLIKDGKPNPFENDFISFYQNVDFATLEKNIKLFEGTFNFINFMKTGSEVQSTTRKIYKSFAYEHKGYIVLYFEANGFLRSQIRLMVGSLFSLNAKEIQEQLNATAKYKVKPAKPNGLYLAKIKY